MASFAQKLQSLRSGHLSFDDLLEEVDRILAEGRVEAARLLDSIYEEDAESPLPTGVCDILRDKLEPLMQKEDLAQSSTNVQAQSVTTNDVEGTQHASAYRLQETPVSSAGESRTDTTMLNDDSGPTKVTGDLLNNRFELQERVGSGGMSTVYKAIDRRKVEANDRHPYVAVKVLNLEFRTHPDALIALQREAKKSQSLSHPNIVRVYDFDRDGSTVYMTLEYLSGASLAREVNQPDFKGMDKEEALRIINDMGKALSFAHNSGIVHADFKPANVFITDDDKIKVIDFGIARAIQLDDAVDLEATRFDPGILGALTPTYASPEMLEHQEPDPRDDIYALACTAYLMLTGFHPFGRVPATVARETGLQLKRRNPLSWSQFKALKRALEFERSKRTTTVDQFLKEINRSAGTIAKYATAFGFIGILVIMGIAAGYYYSKRAGESSTTELTAQDKQAKTEITDSPAPTADSNDAVKPDASNATSRQKPQTTRADTDKLARIEQPSSSKTITSAEITRLLANMPCAALKALIQDGNVSVKGYALAQERQKLEQMLAESAGFSKADTSGIEPVDRHKCAIIEQLSGQWTINQGLKNRTSITLSNPDNQYLEGENLIVNIATADYDTYLYVDYYSLDGDVLHMVPSPRFIENQAPARYSATIGDLGEWAIAKPFGTELIVVIATPEPLFDSMRSEHEPQTQYLADLERRLAQLMEKGMEERITADFILITTKAR